jgi:hypothetical protein
MKRRAQYSMLMIIIVFLVFSRTSVKSQVICNILSCPDPTEITLIICSDSSSLSGCIIWFCDNTMFEVPNGFQHSIGQADVHRQSETFSVFNIAKAVSSKKDLTPAMESQIRAIKKYIQDNLPIFEKSAQRRIVINKDANSITLVADRQSFAVAHAGQVFTLDEMLSMPGVPQSKIIAQPSNPYYTKQKTNTAPTPRIPTENNVKTNIDISIFPNPTEEEFCIEISSNSNTIEKGYIHITTVDGQTIKIFPINDTVTRLTARDIQLPQGVYFVRYSSEKSDNKKSGKMLIIK